MEWGFIWLMFVLKIPIVALLTLVWWAIKQEADPDQHWATAASAIVRHRGIRARRAGARAARTATRRRSGRPPVSA